MNRQEYEQEVLSDCRSWIDENHTYYDNFELAKDEMELVVTGNDNGSYYCNTARAEEAVSGVIFDAVIAESLKFNLGTESGIPTERGAEVADVYVRFACFNNLIDKIESYFNEVKEHSLIPT